MEWYRLLFMAWTLCFAQDSFGVYIPRSAAPERLKEADEKEEFVTPIETDFYGHPVSHGKSRIRRSLDDTTRYFALEGLGQRFHLEVEPNANLLSPGFKVYHRKSSSVKAKTTTTVENVPGMDRCLYTGQSRLHSDSSVALNLCDGMTGLIKTSSEEFLIEQALDPTNSSRTHILRKRSALPTAVRPGNRRHKGLQTHFCGRKRRYMPHVPPKNHWLPDEFPEAANITRRKRSYEDSGVDDEDDEPLKSVETLVVADRDMVQKHGTENVTTYILTVFNMVSMLYQDTAIGNNVSVVLVGLVLLEGDEPGLTLSHSAEQSLNSFCQWQSTIHTSRGTKHDHAVLVTGKDICSWKEGPCDTLGYAPISGMCSKYRSCTVNEDSGLALAFTIAHEIGHNFGMVHDGQGNSPCKKAKGTIMSPSLSGLDSTYLWSSCSRKDLARFLKSSRAICLKNKPDFPDELQFPDRLPGQLYDGHMQCKFQFGRKSKLCEHYSLKGEICRALWCEKNGRKCETKFLPAAEGTSCGKNKWCRKGVCVDQEKEEIEPIDGGWGPYSEWSNCTRACGGGLRTRERKCDSPKPRNGGAYCKGRSKEYKICNTEECYPSHRSLDQDHCSTFNHRTVKSKQYQWKPYEKDLGALARCRIYCTPDKEDTYLILSTKLPDGTSCQGNYASVCVEGDCRPVGCDGKVDSKVSPDRCGVCNGDNTTCKQVTGSYQILNLTRGYHQIIKIPSGSRHIQVSEAKESSAYLALRNARGHYYLTGGWAIDWPGRYIAGGCILSYRRWPGQPESFLSKGPTNEDLFLEVLMQQPKPVTINYEFVVPSPKPVWAYFNSSCSTTCGEGVTISYPKCTDPSGTVLQTEQCGFPVPPNITLKCLHASCSQRWHSMEWSECKGNCRSGWKYRTVLCEHNGLTVKDSECEGQVKPAVRQRCTPKYCQVKSTAKLRTQCPGQCSSGKPKQTKNCGKFSHAQNVACNDTIQPSSHHECTENGCLHNATLGTWIAGPWGKCNAKCGRGIQTRNVSCIPLHARSFANSAKAVCDEKSKPIQHSACTGVECRSVVPRASNCYDHHRWCNAFTAHKACQYRMYATKCCKTCSKLL